MRRSARRRAATAAAVAIIGVSAAGYLAWQRNLAPLTGSASPGFPTSATTAPSATTNAPEGVVVTDAGGLQRARAKAKPGTTITSADGRYVGIDLNDRSGWQPGES